MADETDILGINEQYATPLVDDIFEEEVEVVDTRSPEEIRAEREKKIIGNVGKFGVNVADWMVEEATIPTGIAVGIFNFGSSIADGPQIPNPLQLNEFVQSLAKQEYDTDWPNVWGTAAIGTSLVASGVAYDKTLDKIKAAYPKLYNKLRIAFPYSVGQIHGITTQALSGGAAIAKTKQGKLSKAKNVIKGLAKKAWPTTTVRHAVRANIGNLLKFGTLFGAGTHVITTKPTGGSGELSDTVSGRLDHQAKVLLGDDAKYFDIYGDTELAHILEPFYMDMDGKFNQDKLFELDGEQFHGQNIYSKSDVEKFAGMRPLTREELDQREKEIDEETKRRDKLLLSDKWKEDWADWAATTKAGKSAQAISKASNLVGASVRSFLYGKDEPEEEVYDFYSETVEAQADDHADKVENEKLRTDMMKVNRLPSYEELYGKDGKFPPKKMRYGGDPNEGGIFTESIETEDPYMKLDPKVLEEQPFVDEWDIFEEAKKEGFQEYQVAGNLLGKVPMWAMANVDKWKMLLQDFTKHEKKNMDNIKEKLGTEAQVNKTEEIDILDMPSGATTVGPVKNKKTIIDSPEANESVFYSGLEAKLMDPNTPKSFSGKEEFLHFLQAKGISKAEVEDNILTRYIEVANKNGVPLQTRDMLKIVRQSPMRQIDTVTYGDAKYGGTKRAVYGGAHKESGEIPGSYREEVLFLDPKYIPYDPDNLPGSSHDFTERYVIGWSRLTDRKATLPVDKTKAGITDVIDEKQMRTIKKNQKKLASQVDGLYASAYSKLFRKGEIDLQPIDQLTSREIKDIVNQYTFDLEDLDAPLFKQIKQFEDKLMADNIKLNKFKEMKEGQKVTVTFADEIQSDILQQAKKLENDLREQLGDILDMPAEKRMAALGEQIARYRGSAREVKPEVLEFYTKNESIFRPMFQTAEDMQQFVDEFAQNKKVFEEISKAGPSPSDELMKRMNIAIKKEKEMLNSLDIALSEGAMKQLFPNVPFKNRSEWGSALVKRDLAKAAKLLYQDKVPDAGEWYVISPSKLITKRYGQKGGTHIPMAERTKDMQGIGTEEFYGGPKSLSSTLDADGKPKHYTSTLEKILKTLAKENNSEFKILNVDGIGEAYGIKITPEMLLPHKTHRKDGGMVYSPEIIDIFEAA
jgi:hypothetical protein